MDEYATNRRICRTSTESILNSVGKTMVIKENSESKEYEMCYILGATRIMKLVTKDWNTETEGLYDIKICIKESSFFTHKLIICAYSNSLKRRLINFPRGRMINIKLPSNYDIVKVSQVIDMLYQNRPSVTDTDIGDFLQISHLLDFHIITEFCKAHMESFNMSSVIKYSTIAKKYGFFNLSRRYYIYMCENFKKLIYSKTLLHLSPEDFHALISDSNIIVDSEADVLAALIRWTDFNRQDRESYFEDFLSTIRFIQMSPEELIQKVEKYKEVSLCPCGKGYNTLLYQALRFHALRYSGSTLTPRISEGQKERRNKESNAAWPDPKINTNPYKVLEGVEITLETSLEQYEELAEQIKTNTSVLENGGLQNESNHFEHYLQSPHDNKTDDYSQTYQATPLIQSLKFTPKTENKLELTKKSPKLQLFKENTTKMERSNESLRVRGSDSDDWQTTSSEETGISTQPNEYNSLADRKRPISYEDSFTNEYRVFSGRPAPKQKIAQHVLVVVGGVNLQNSNDGILANNMKSIDLASDDLDQMSNVSRKQQWSHVTELPYSTHHHGVALVNNNIYVIGGSALDYKDQEALGTATSLVYVYQIHNCKWEKRRSMTTGRTYHSVCAHGNYIYVVGGEDEQKREVDTVDRYDTITDEWILLTRMPKGAKIGTACCVFNGHIFVVGGYSVKSGMALSDVESYNIEERRWTPHKPLDLPRCHANLVEIKGRLYLAAGRNRYMEKDTPTISSLTSIGSIKVFDEKTDSWQHISNLRIPRHDCGCVTIGTKIYVIGGMETPRAKCSSLIECYDVVARKWLNNVPELPTPAAGLASFVLTI